MKRLHKRFLLATFCALFTATLQAADVTITVNGRVVAKPCTIQTKEANVNLGDLYTRNLQQPGSGLPDKLPASHPVRQLRWQRCYGKQRAIKVTLSP